MGRTAAQRRRDLEELLAAGRPDQRYADLVLQLRRLTADFPQEVDVDHVFYVGEVELRTSAAGREGVPVVASRAQESTALPDGAPIEGGGTLRAEVILRAGGRWDRIQKCYTKEPAQRPFRFDLVESQVEPATWFAAWLRRYAGRQGDARRRRERDKRALLHYGARGGGKTVIGLLLMIAVALEVPDSIVWVISCSRPQSEEDIRENLSRMLPAGWAAYAGQPKYRWRFVNGSRLREMTADAPEDLKQGRVDAALLNEGAKMDRRAYGYPIGRVSDRGGLLWVATNPPTIDVPKGVWVQKLYERHKEAEQRGEWFPLHVIRSESKQNAAIIQAAREDVALLIAAVSPELAKADAEGLMVGIGSRLIYAYDRGLHGRAPPPDLPDVTEQVTKARYGRAFPWLCGADFQDTPYIIGSFWKAYGTIERPILYCWGDFTVKGSEDDWLDELIEQGIQVAPPDHADAFVQVEQGTILFIADSSAQWQDTKHRGQQLIDPPSFSFFRQRGLHVVPPTRKISPQARFARNPLRGPSYGQCNRWIGTGRCVLGPLAVRTDEALVECLMIERNGKAQAEPRWSHPIDCLRYVLWWVEPPTNRWVSGGGSARAAGGAAR